MVWSTYLEAKTWGIRPSELLGIRNEYVAYCFDQAVGYAGTYIEAELDKVGYKPDKKERSIREGRKRRLETLLKLNGADETQKSKSGFADPADLFK